MKFFLKLFAVAVLAYLVAMPLRAYSFIWNSIGEGILFFVLTYVALKRYGAEHGIGKVVLPIVVGLLFFEVPMRVFSFQEALISLPHVIGSLLAILVAVVFYKYKSIVALLMGIALWLGIATEGQKYIGEYFFYGESLDANVAADVMTAVSGEETTVAAIDGEYLLLDFWSSSCGVCFVKFPIVQELYDNVAGNPKVKLASVFVAYREGEDVHRGEEILKDKGYTFPVYSIEKDNPIMEKCIIDGFPTVLILDGQRNLIFRGSIEFAKDKLKKLHLLEAV